VGPERLPIRPVGGRVTDRSDTGVPRGTRRAGVSCPGCSTWNVSGSRRAGQWSLVAVPRWPGPPPVTEFRLPSACRRADGPARAIRPRSARRSGRAARPFVVPLSLSKGHHERTLTGHRPALYGALQSSWIPGSPPPARPLRFVAPVLRSPFALSLSKGQAPGRRDRAAARSRPSPAAATPAARRGAAAPVRRAPGLHVDAPFGRAGVRDRLSEPRRCAPTRVSGEGLVAGEEGGPDSPRLDGAPGALAEPPGGEGRL
jgi:hypothetical protein